MKDIYTRTQIVNMLDDVSSAVLIYLHGFFLLFLHTGAYASESPKNRVQATLGKCYKKFNPHKSNYSTYTPYILRTHIHINQIYTDPQRRIPVLQNQNYYMLTYTSRQDIQKRI
jgi:hypothetical protein